MTTNYEQGRDTEYKAARDMEKLGFTTARMAGSHSSVDLIAWNNQTTKFIQCKSWRVRPGSYKPDIAKLVDLDLPPYSTAELWVRKVGMRGWAVQRVIKSTMPEQEEPTT